MFHSPPPSPVDTMTRTSTPNITLESEIILAGFRGCRYEAVTYLLEVEQLSLDDPLVVGLQKHLEEKEAELYRNPETTDNNNTPYVQALLWQQILNSQNSLMSPTPLSPSEHVLTLPDTSLGSDGAQDMSVASEMTFDDSICDDEVESILDNHDYDIDSVKEGAEYLDSLAKNNGKIGCLLEELFGLMEDGDYDEDEDDIDTQGAGLSVDHFMSC